MALSDVASPSSGEVWSWGCGSESVSGHPASTTTASHVTYVTEFGPDWRRARRGAMLSTRSGGGEGHAEGPFQ
jgi:hypothetical protein